jgi:hypothetical protein
MAAIKIYFVELIDESWFYVFATSKRDALGYVVSTNYPDYSIAEFKREYDPHVRLMRSNEVIEIEDDDEKTFAEWLATDDAKHLGCWMSNRYEY